METYLVLWVDEHDSIPVDGNEEHLRIVNLSGLLQKRGEVNQKHH